MNEKMTYPIATVTPPLLYKIILIGIFIVLTILLWFIILLKIVGPNNWTPMYEALPILLIIIYGLRYLYLRLTKLSYLFYYDHIAILNYKGEEVCIPYTDILEARPKNAFLSAISLAHLEIIFKCGDETQVTNIYFLDDPEFYRSIIFEGRFE